MLRIQQSKILLYIAPVLLALFFAGSITYLNTTYFVALVVIIVVLPIFIIYPEVSLVFYTTSIGFIDPFCESLGIPSGLRALPIALLIVSLLIFFALRKKKGIHFGALPIVSMGIGILLILGLKWTPSPDYGFWKAQAYVLYNLLIMFGLTVFVGEKERLNRIVYMAAFMGIIYSFIGFYFSISFLKGSLETVRFSIPILTTKGASDPIGLAYSLGVFILALIMLVEISNSKIQRILLLSFIFGLVFLMFNTATRGPTGSLVFTFGFYLFFATKRPLYKNILILVIIGVISYVVFLHVSPDVQNRYFSMLEGSDHQTNIDYQGGRMEIWHVTIQAIKTHLFKGLGTGGFSHYYYLVDGRSYPHNLILEMVLEFGIVGLSAIGIFLFLNFKIIFDVFRTHSNVTEDNFPLIWASLVFIYSFLNSMVSFDIPGNKLLWFGSGFLWTAYITDKAMKEAYVGLKLKI